MPKSLAFEFYLMKRLIEQIKNTVKSKNLQPACAICVAAHRRPPAHERLDHLVQLERGSRDHARLDRNAKFPL
jgi:hypothetical protein